MRHRKKGKKLSRNTKSRKALFKNLLTDFFLFEALVTTQAKAQVIKGKIDRLITKAKNPTLVNKRFIYGYLTKPSVSAKLVDDIAPRFSKRRSGYSRIIKLGSRQGDQAPMAKIELVAPLESPKDVVNKKTKKSNQTSSAKKGASLKSKLTVKTSTKKK
ncbi:MAG: 50S ribosomal protein L17 [Candidatus Shapirobacteria bacterium]|nr:50S ribosomal protein L17 [Candidatus Shapirobacteria bacterium]